MCALMQLQPLKLLTFKTTNNMKTNFNLIEVIQIIKDIQKEYEESGKSFCTAKTIWEICENKIDELQNNNNKH
jgi:hypothetical protein